MPNLRELWGRRPLTDLAAQVSIPFRRLEEYAAGTRPLTAADRATLAAFFQIAPADLAQPTTAAAAAPTPVPRGRGKVAGPTQAPPALRSPRPSGAPAPTMVVTTQGSGEARVSGQIQRAPEPVADPRGGPPRFWLLELLVPHQPLRGSAQHAALLVRCAIRRHQLDPYRWLERGDRIIVRGTPTSRSDHLYLVASSLSTPRAERLRQLLLAWRAGDGSAEPSLLKLLGAGWPQLAPEPGSGLQEQRPPWTPAPEPLTGPHGRVQITLQGQLQADPSMEIDEDGGGLAELRLEIAPPSQEAQLPVTRYLVYLRPRALREHSWLQRGDTVAINGDIVAVSGELLVEASTIEH